VGAAEFQVGQVFHQTRLSRSRWSNDWRGYHPRHPMPLTFDYPGLSDLSPNLRIFNLTRISRVPRPLHVETGRSQMKILLMKTMRKPRITWPTGCAKKAIWSRAL
jgi:hypothetical protein